MIRRFPTTNSLPLNPDLECRDSAGD